MSLDNHVKKIIPKRFSETNINALVRIGLMSMDIVSAAAIETLNAIMKELGGALFYVLVDESRDISVKEQMVVVIRYVNNQGTVVERFIGVMHVRETTAIVLKTALDEIVLKHGLSMQRLRGQGYDGVAICEMILTD